MRLKDLVHTKAKMHLTSAAPWKAQRILSLVFVLVDGYLSANDTCGYRGEINNYMVCITKSYDTCIKSHEGDRDLAGS